MIIIVIFSVLNFVRSTLQSRGESEIYQLGSKCAYFFKKHLQKDEKSTKSIFLKTKSLCGSIIFVFSRENLNRVINSLDFAISAILGKKDFAVSKKSFFRTSGEIDDFCLISRVKCQISRRFRDLKECDGTHSERVHNLKSTE